jgi:hypothetical protein
MPTSYAPSNDPNSIVVDSSLRTISNLIVDQTITNPAAVARFVEAGLGVLDATACSTTSTTRLPATSERWYRPV